MRNAILGLIFIGICAFSIIQTREAIGRGERSETQNMEVKRDYTDSHARVQRGTASGRDCYSENGREVCSDVRPERTEGRSEKLDNVPSEKVEFGGTERTESSELGNK